ncbi:MAG: hypothetical protein WAM14_23700 [Candidatus Nitrosopolaris sp.]
MLKACFVVAPIGTEESQMKLRSDQIFKHVIEPGARLCGYEPIRADDMSQPPTPGLSYHYTKTARIRFGAITVFVGS